MHRHHNHPHSQSRRINAPALQQTYPNTPSSFADPPPSNTWFN